MNAMESAMHEKGAGVMSDTLKRRVLAVIRDYPRMKDRYHEILHSGGSVRISHIGSQKSGKTTSDTERKAIMLTALGDGMQAVEQALILVPEEYRRGVFDGVVHGVRAPSDAGRSTYWRWTQRFICNVAINLNLA